MIVRNKKITPGRAPEPADPKRTRMLFLNTGRAEVSITDERGRPVTLEEAKLIWESGTLKDFNLALHRLASMNWDYDALKAYYAKGGRP